MNCEVPNELICSETLFSFYSCQNIFETAAILQLMALRVIIDIANKIL